jgi:hypothetical protein
MQGPDEEFAIGSGGHGRNGRIGGLAFGEAIEKGFAVPIVKGLCGSTHAHPKAAAWSGQEAEDMSDGGAEAGFFFAEFEIDAVKSQKASFGSEPEVAVAGLRNRVDGSCG